MPESPLGLVYAVRAFAASVALIAHALDLGMTVFIASQLLPGGCAGSPCPRRVFLPVSTLRVNDQPLDQVFQRFAMVQVHALQEIEPDSFDFRFDERIRIVPRQIAVHQRLDRIGTLLHIEVGPITQGAGTASSISGRTRVIPVSLCHTVCQHHVLIILRIGAGASLWRNEGLIGGVDCD